MSSPSPSTPGATFDRSLSDAGTAAADAAASATHAAPGGEPVFAPAYDAWLPRQLAAREPRNRDGWISPSQVGGCVTAAIHQLNGEPRATMHGPELDDLFTIANQIHDHYQQRGQEMGILTDCERFVEIPEWRVRGQVDGVLTRPDGTQALLEIKTVPEWLWEKIADEGAPLRGNLPQNALYLAATGLTTTHFLYVERSYFRKLEVVWQLDQALLQDVELWIRRVLDLQARGEYPEAAEVWKPEGRCAGCSYVATCRERLYGPGSAADSPGRGAMGLPPR